RQALSGGQPDGVVAAVMVSTNANLAIASGGATFQLGLNTSGSTQNLGLDVPSEFASLNIADPRSLRLFVDGELSLPRLRYDVGIDGFFATQVRLQQANLELDLLASGRIDLGQFGRFDATGFLEISGNANSLSAGGFFEVSTDGFGIAGIATVTGSANLSFNMGRNLDVPSFLVPLVPTVNLPTSTYVRLELDDARVDLFGGVLAVGGDGFLQLDESSGIALGGNLGVAVNLPDEIVDPFEGFIPDTLRSGPSLPGTGSVGALPTLSGTQTLTFDLGGIGDVTISRDGFSGPIELWGVFDVEADGTAFGGLVRSTADGTLRFNTSSSTKRLAGRDVGANGFDFDLDGRVIVDPLPNNGTTADQIELEAGIRLQIRPSFTRINGTAEFAATVLGIDLVSAAAEANLTVAGGAVTGNFQGNFNLIGVEVFNGDIELLPSGCLDLPGLLPDGCGTIEISISDATVTEGGSGTFVVSLTEPVPTGSTVQVDLAEFSPKLALNTTSFTFTEGQRTRTIGFTAPNESASNEDFADEFITVLITRAQLFFPFNPFPENLTGDTTATVTVLDDDEEIFVEIVPIRDGRDPDTFGENGRTAGFSIRFRQGDGFYAESFPIDVSYAVRP
ncbi:MAG: hypothetical protein AAF743_14920, partial [Planctomycetota bacterium]